MNYHKFIKIFILLFKFKYSFKFPRKNKFLIYDHVRSDYLKIYIKNFTIYQNRFDENLIIYIPLIIKCLINLEFNRSSYKKYFINHVNPKIIITSNDNQVAFFLLKNLFPKIIFIAIQGFWKLNVSTDSIYSFKRFKNLKCDYFFCYNKYIAKIYKKFIDCKNFIIIGSFESNIYPIKKIIKKNTYTFISQFKTFKSDNDKFIKKYTIGDWRKRELLFLNNLKEAIDSNYKIKVIGRSDSNEEINYYKKIFRKRLIFVKNSRLDPKKKQNIFKHLDKSEIIFTLDSTLGYESLARGSKVLFFSIRDNLDENTRSGLRFCWPQKKKEKGLNWTNNYSKNEIKKLIKINKNISRNKWKKFIRANFSETFIYNKNNTFLRKFLNQFI